MSPTADSDIGVIMRLTRALTVLTAVAAVSSALTLATAASAAPESASAHRSFPADPRQPAVTTATAASDISWGDAEPVPGTAALEQGVAGGGGISQISCPSAGNCGAIGTYYTPTSGSNSLPFVDSQVNGTWATAIPVPGLSALDAYLPRLFSLSCSSDGNCTAVGATSTGTSSADVLPLVVTEANGSWGNAQILTGVASLTTSQEAVLLSVSCWSAGNCVAGGTYWDSSGNEQAMVVTQSGGTWTAPQEMPGTAGLNAGGNAAVTAVSCSASGACGAGGSYTAVNSSYLDVASVFLSTGNDGSWNAAEEVPGLTALGGAYPQPVIDAVSCAGSGGCAAGGTYVNSAGTQAFVISGTTGGWNDAVEVPGTANLNSGGTASLASVSCASAGNCAAGGYYTDSSGEQDGFVVDESGGTWGSAQELPGDAALTDGGGSVNVTSVSCAVAGACVAGGQYEYAPEGYAFSGFLDDETDGTWGAAFAVPGLTTLNSGWDGTVASVSCASASYCSAGGSYSDSPGQPFVVSTTGSAPTCQQLTEAEGRVKARMFQPAGAPATSETRNGQTVEQSPTRSQTRTRGAQTPRAAAECYPAGIYADFSSKKDLDKAKSYGWPSVATISGLSQPGHTSAATACSSPWTRSTGSLPAVESELGGASITTTWAVSYWTAAAPPPSVKNLQAAGEAAGRAAGSQINEADAAEVAEGGHGILPGVVALDPEGLPCPFAPDAATKKINGRGWSKAQWYVKKLKASYPPAEIMSPEDWKQFATGWAIGVEAEHLTPAIYVNKGEYKTDRVASFGIDIILAAGANCPLSADVCPIPSKPPVTVADQPLIVGYAAYYGPVTSTGKCGNPAADLAKIASWSAPYSTLQFGYLKTYKKDGKTTTVKAGVSMICGRT